MKSSSTICSSRRNASSELSQKHKDIAASVQRVCEMLIYHILEHLQKIVTGIGQVPEKL